jgi:hypothetical protein
MHFCFKVENFYRHDCVYVHAKESCVYACIFYDLD